MGRGTRGGGEVIWGEEQEESIPHLRWDAEVERREIELAAAAFDHGTRGSDTWQ